jgi:ABC-type phosphate transport system permease subunit
MLDNILEIEVAVLAALGIVVLGFLALFSIGSLMADFFDRG